MIQRISLGLVILLIAAAPALAQTTLATRATSREASEPPGAAAAPDKLVSTEHQITVAGEALKYRATAGPLLLKDDTGKPKASFFFVAYEKLPAGNPADRPITFVFNGGPGAAAVWLHLGAAGPKRIDLDADGLPHGPPCKLVDNPQTWLAFTDLVFIDPVGTGYSRPAPGEKLDEFLGVDQDINWVAEFIRVYLTRYQRWASPKFLAGESYGTTRAAGLSEFLHEHHGIDVNGIVLISTVLNFQTLEPAEGNDLPYVLYLPSYTAVAWYHKKLGDDLQKMELSKLLKEVEAWALGEYQTALAQGSALKPDERKAIADKLAKYTALPADIVDQANLRIGPFTFQKSLLQDKRQVIGRFDARITGFNAKPLAPWPEYDPSLDRYLGVYTSTFADYIRRELKYENDQKYEVLAGVGNWPTGRNWGRLGGGYLNMSENLRSAMLKNPHMKVLFASGYFDLATPYLGTDYTIGHLELDKALQANITRTLYPAGHMIYHPQAGLEKLSGDVGEFVRVAIKK